MIVSVILNSKQGLNGILEVVNPKRYIHTGSNRTAVLLVATVLTCLLHPAVSGCRSLHSASLPALPLVIAVLPHG